MKQLFERICSRVLPRSKHQTSSTSRHPDAPDAQPTTTATDVTSLSRPLPVSPAQGTSRLDVSVNQPSTVPGPTAIGENTGHASCIDRQTQFTDHNSPFLDRTPGNPTSYTIGGMYWILAWHSITKSAPKLLPLRALHFKLEKTFRPMAHQL